jgi:hypothetical protein
MSKFNVVAYWLTSLFVLMTSVTFLFNSYIAEIKETPSPFDNIVYMSENNILSVGMKLFFASIYLICCGFFFMGFILFFSSIYRLSLSSKDYDQQNVKSIY